MFYFVYCKVFVLNEVNGTCWRARSLVAVRVPEMSFWRMKTKKKLKLLEKQHVFELVLKCC